MKLTEKQLQTVKEGLCCYDPRNPLADHIEGEPSKDCYCDSCFRGTAYLSEMILDLIELPADYCKACDNTTLIAGTRCPYCI